MENFEQVTLQKMKKNILTHSFILIQKHCYEIKKQYEAETHPCWLQIVLQGLADHSRVLHGDGWAREILVSYFGLQEKKSIGFSHKNDLYIKHLASCSSFSDKF